MLITRVWSEQPGRYFCLSSKTRSGRWEDHFFSRKELAGVADFVRAHRDRDLYWCPHGFQEPRRTKDNAAETTLLWADLDEVTPQDCKPMPTIAWRSSPNRYAAIWRCDAPTNETLNRRLTYALGADRGGWDLTQVLRVPGTFNYKYPSAPQVRLLWDDGPVHGLRDVAELLPAHAVVQDYRRDAERVYRRYESTLSPFARRHLLRGKPQEGKRSEVLWRLCQEILEAGCSEEETFLLLRASPWNKFAGRRDEEDQLRREISKAIGRKLEAQPIQQQAEEREEDDSFIIQMSEVEERELDWIWYPYLARGEITLVEGDPGVGKSYLTQMVAAHICDGRQLPQFHDTAPEMPEGRVLYFTIENTAATTAKRRLIDNGCENMERFYQGEKFFTMDDEDIEKVEAAMERSKPTLVVFDPVNTYLGKADTNNPKETQQALAIFKDLANRFNCAILLIRHLTKNTITKALYRGTGSIAFIGVARICLTVAWHPRLRGVRVMAPNKVNFTASPRALAYTISPIKSPKLDRSKLVWGEFCELTADELLSTEETKEQQDRTADVQEFLDEMLRDGGIPEQELLANARARGFEDQQVQEVARMTGVRISGGDRGKRWRAAVSASKTLAVSDTSAQVRFGARRPGRNGSPPTSRKPR